MTKVMKKPLPATINCRLQMMDFKFVALSWGFTLGLKVVFMTTVEKTNSVAPPFWQYLGAQNLPSLHTQERKGYIIQHTEIMQSKRMQVDLKKSFMGEDRGMH